MTHDLPETTKQLLSDYGKFQALLRERDDRGEVDKKESAAKLNDVRLSRRNYVLSVDEVDGFLATRSSNASRFWRRHRSGFVAVLGVAPAQKKETPEELGPLLAGEFIAGGDQPGAAPVSESCRFRHRSRDYQVTEGRDVLPATTNEQPKPPTLPVRTLLNRLADMFRKASSPTEDWIDDQSEPALCRDIDVRTNMDGYWLRYRIYYQTDAQGALAPTYTRCIEFSVEPEGNG